MDDRKGSGNTGIIAVLVIFLVVALGVGVFAFRDRIFGPEPKAVDKLEVNLTIPAK